MKMLGADVVALRQMSRALRHQQRSIDATRLRLSAAVESLPWSGDDHRHFVDEWRRTHEPALVRVAADMGDAADSARYHARRQEQASRPR